MEDIPETWDTIKYEKPIYPTCSQGKFGDSAFCNNKFHCYGVQHSKPFYNLTPYQAKGFGYGERAMNYVPLSHVQNRGRPSPPTKRLLDKAFMREVYENSIDALRKKRDERFETEIKSSQRRHDRLRDKFRYQLKGLKNKTDEFIGDTKYRCFQINRTIHIREL